jgi:DNA-binding LytR/AlgR family response regulator
LQAVQKVVDANKDSGATSTSHAGGQGEADDYIFVKTESKGKLLKINLGEIDFIEGMKNYVAIHCAEKKTLVYTSMKELEERLPQKAFLRVHKSYIIPIAKITGIEGNLLRLKDVKIEILIGENYKPDLMEIIRNKMIQ